MAAGSNCTLNVIFTPTQEGAANGQLTVGSVVINLNGAGVSPVSISPSSLSFSLQQVVNTRSLPQSITVTNTDPSNAVNVTNLTVTGANAASFTATNGCANIPVNSNCTIPVVFTPTSVNPNSALTATLNFTADGVTKTVNLTAPAGTAVLPGISPATLDFGNRTYGTTPELIVTLTNPNSSGDLTINSNSITGTNLANFAVDLANSNCAATLKAATSCHIAVQFTPGLQLNQLMTASLAVNTAAGVQNVALTGTSVVPVITTAAPLTFPSVQAGEIGQTLIVNVSNPSTDAYSLSNVTFSGTAGVYQKTGDSCLGSIPGAISNNNPGTCQISVDFTPSVVGTMTSNMNIGAGTVSLPLTGISVAPSAALSTPTLAFGTTELGAIESMSATLTNTGIGSLKNITVSNPLTPFSLVSGCSASIPVGGNCTITVGYTASATTLQSATMSITDGLVGSPLTQTLALTGTGVAAKATVSPASLAFASTQVGQTSAPQSVTLTNTGTVLMTVTNVTFSGTAGNYAVVSNNCNNIAKGSTCSISVDFTPQTAAVHNSTMTISDGTATTSRQTVTLTGTGVAPTAGVSPGALTFASTQVGQTNATSQLVTLTNTGLGPWTLTNLALAGANPGNYSQTNNCNVGAAMAAGASCTVTVYFTPTATGSRPASLTFTDTAGTQTVTLAGTGAAPTAGVSPGALTFTSTQVGQTNATPQTVTLTNTGLGPWTLTNLALAGANSGNYSQTNNCNVGAAMAAGASCTVTVSFTPTATGSRPASLTFTDTVATQTVTLAGTGAAPILSLGGNTTYSFGNVNGVASNTFTLTNTGTNAAPFVIGSIATTKLNTGNGSYSLPTPVTGNCVVGATLAVGSTCTMSLTLPHQRVITQLQAH